MQYVDFVTSACRALWFRHKSFYIIHFRKPHIWICGCAYFSKMLNNEKFSIIIGNPGLSESWKKKLNSCCRMIEDYPLFYYLGKFSWCFSCHVDRASSPFHWVFIDIYLNFVYFTMKCLNSSTAWYGRYLHWIFVFCSFAHRHYFSLFIVCFLIIFYT